MRDCYDTLSNKAYVLVNRWSYGGIVFENHRGMKMSRSHHLIDIFTKKKRNPNDRSILSETW